MLHHAQSGTYTSYMLTTYEQSSSILDAPSYKRSVQLLPLLRFLSSLATSLSLCGVQQSCLLLRMFPVVQTARGSTSNQNAQQINTEGQLRTTHSQDSSLSLPTRAHTSLYNADMRA
eukprot:4681708-Amphidinium_carterae.1